MTNSWERWRGSAAKYHHLGKATGSPERNFAAWVRTGVFTLNIPASADLLAQLSLRRLLMGTGNLDLNITLLKRNTRIRKRDPRRPIFQSFSSSFVSCSRSTLDVGQARKKYWSIRGLRVSKRHNQRMPRKRHGIWQISSNSLLSL